MADCKYCEGAGVFQQYDIFGREDGGRNCTQCHGTGDDPRPDCESCKGTGYVFDGNDGGRMMCDECGGEGKSNKSS